MHGTYLNVGEKVDDPEWYAGEVEPIDIIERVVEGLPPDKAYANNIDRGRYEPYQTRDFGPLFSNKVVAKLIHVC